MQCQKCGNSANNDKYCSECGSLIDNSNDMVNGADNTTILSNKESNRPTEVTSIQENPGDGFISQTHKTDITDKNKKGISFTKPKGKKIPIIIALCLILLSVPAIFILNFSSNTPKTPEEANKIFTKIQASINKELQNNKYAEAAKLLVKHDSIANELIKNQNGDKQYSRELYEVAIKHKEISKKIMEPKYTEIITSLNSQNNTKGITNIFYHDLVSKNIDEKITLMEIVAKAYAKEGDFEKVYSSLRFMMSPFTEEGFNKSLDIQQFIIKTYSERAKEWSNLNELTFDEVGPFNDGFSIVGRKIENTMKWGVIDSNGKLICDTKYDKIYKFLEDKAAVKINGKWGFINKSGQEVIPPKYSDIKEPMDKVFYAEVVPYPDRTECGFYNGYAAVKYNGKWGFIDSNDKPLGEGFVYLDVQAFNEDRATVKKYGSTKSLKNYKAGIIDTNGNYIIAPNQDRYDLGGRPFNVIRSIYEGLAGANFNNLRDRCLIDRDGNIAQTFSRSYIDLVQDFREGLAACRYKSKWGFLDRHGNIVVSIRYDKVKIFKDGLAQVKKGKYWGVVDSGGYEVVTPKYNSIGDFKSDIAVVKKGNKYGYIDKSGSLITKIEFTKANDFSNGVASVQIGGKWGVISTNGKFIISPLFEGLGKYENGVLPAKINGKWGYADRSGYFVIEPIFDEAKPFNEGFAWVKKDSKYVAVKLNSFPFTLQTLISDINGKPIPDINALICKAGEANPLYITTSDKNGIINATIPEGEYVIKVTKEGYKTSEFFISFKEGSDRDSSNSVIVLLKKDITNFYDDIVLVKDGKNLIDKTIKVNDAFDGRPVSGVSVKLRYGFNNTTGTCVKDSNGNDYQFASDQLGEIYIKAIPGIYTAEIIKEGYTNAYLNIAVGAEEEASTIKSYPITQKMPKGETRITLEWGSTPGDLDSHLVGPSTYNEREKFHVYYSDKCNECDNNDEDTNHYDHAASLDHDDRWGNGFETVTIRNQSNGTYEYFVHDYTNESSYSSNEMSYSGAKVKVYRGSACVAVFDVPKRKTGKLWRVFEMNGDTITPINQIDNYFDYEYFNR